MPVDLKGKTAVVTGGSRGLGAAIVDAFTAAGAKVWAPDRWNYDLLESEGPAEIIQSARGLFHSLDILVNNAAIQGPAGPADSNAPTDWEETIRVDMIAPCMLSMFAAYWMRQTFTKGSIINISGGGAASPRPNYSAYATAKCGLVRFSETIAEELRESGIRVNCVAPGKLNCGMGDADGDDPAMAAELVAYLASDASAPITGKLISAKWDPWSDLSRNLAKSPDMYTLRRIVP